MATRHEFKVKIGDQIVAICRGEDRKRSLDHAVWHATRFAELGYEGVSIDGISAEDWASIDAPAGWPKTVVQ